MYGVLCRMYQVSECLNFLFVHTKEMCNEYWNVWNYIFLLPYVERKKLKDSKIIWLYVSIVFYYGKYFTMKNNR
jgi:hypothetical protein